MTTGGSTGGLRVREISVSFGARVVLDRVSLHVATGETVAVMGPSGQGKSTLLRAIAGLQAISSGTIEVNGQDLSSVPVHRRNLGFVFQDFALFSHLNVEDNIAYGLRRHRVGRAERRDRVIELLALVGLSGTERRSVATLSGGEQQRIAIARALAPRPSLLLLDEPLSAVDTDRRAALADEIGRIITSTSVTALYVTHDRDEADRVAHRVIELGSAPHEFP